MLGKLQQPVGVFLSEELRESHLDSNFDSYSQKKSGGNYSEPQVLCLESYGSSRESLGLKLKFRRTKQSACVAYWEV